MPIDEAKPVPADPDRFAAHVVFAAAFGLVLRVAYLFVAQSDPLWSDGLYHHVGANLLADGRGWINPIGILSGVGSWPDAHHPPLWRLTLGAASALGFRTVLSHQVLGALIGTATVVLVGMAARQFAGARVGAVAAYLSAIYPGFWMYERELLSETLVLPGVAMVLLVASRFRASGSLSLAVALAAGCTLLALTRAEQALLLPVLVAPLIVMADATLQVRMRSALAACATAFVLVAPWTAYNRDRFRNPVLFSTGIGYVMAVSNCDSTYGGELLGYFDFSCLRVPTSVKADASIASAKMRDWALEYAERHLTDLPGVFLARLGRTWSVYRPFQQVELYGAWIGTRRSIIVSQLVAFWIVAPLAVLGGVLIRRRKRTLWILLAPLVPVVVASLMTFGQPRYRASAEVPLVVLAAVAIEAAWRRASVGHPNRLSR